MGMEKVSAFGKPGAAGSVSAQNRDGFEIQESSAAGSGPQALEKVGAGDGI